MRAYETERSSSYKPYIKETMLKNCLLLHKSKKRKLIKESEEGKRKEGKVCFFCFVFAAVNTRARGSNHTVSIL